MGRYDNRGVFCNEFTMPPCGKGSDELQITPLPGKLHRLSGVRRGVTVATNLEDIEAAYAYVVEPLATPRRPGRDRRPLRGGINVARLIGQRRIRPKGAVFIASIAESPKGVFMWQTIDRTVAKMMGWDADHDGVVSRADVERSYSA